MCREDHYAKFGKSDKICDDDDDDDDDDDHDDDDWLLQDGWLIKGV